MPFDNIAVRKVMALEKSHSLAFSVRVEDRLHTNILDEVADQCWFTVRPESFVVKADDDDLPTGGAPATGLGFRADGTFYEQVLSVEEAGLLSLADQERVVRESRLFLFDVQATALNLDPELEWYYDISYSKDGYSVSVANGRLQLNANPTNRGADELFAGTGDVYRLVSTIEGRNILNVTTVLPMPQDGPAGIGTYVTSDALASTISGVKTIELSEFMVPSGRSLGIGDLIYSTDSPGILGFVTQINWSDTPVTVDVTTVQRFGVDGLNALTYGNMIIGPANNGDPSYSIVITPGADWVVNKTKVPLPNDGAHEYHVGDLVIGFAASTNVSGAPAKLFVGLIKVVLGSQLTVTTKYIVNLMDSDSMAGLLASKADAGFTINGVGLVDNGITLTLDSLAETATSKKLTGNERTKLGALPDAATLAASLAGKSNVGHQHVITDVTNLQATLNSKVGSSDITTIRVMSLSSYNALATKDARTQYLIVG